MTIVTIIAKAHSDQGSATCVFPKSKQTAENRERILKAAARLMRERGTSGVGVDALTEAAGMTHGSLHSQFGSKEQLVEEAVAYAITTKGQEVPEVFAVSDYVSEYLSAAHRDAPGSGPKPRSATAVHLGFAGHGPAVERPHVVREEATATR